MALDGLEADETRLARDVVAVRGRDAGADPVPVVGPPVVGAYEVFVLDPAERERRPAVDAEVLEGCDLARETDDHDRLVEQRRWPGTVRQLICPYDRVPEAPQGDVQGLLARAVEHVFRRLVRCIHAGTVANSATTTWATGRAGQGREQGVAVGDSTDAEALCPASTDGHHRRADPAGALCPGRLHRSIADCIEASTYRS